MAAVYVSLPVPLRKFSKGASKVEVDADTALNAILQLNKLDISLSQRLLDDTQKMPKKFIKIYLEGKDLAKHGGLDAQVRAGNTIEIVTAFAGG
jgi:molybdopterin converting factor small subunit